MKTKTKHFWEFVWGDKKSLWQHQRRANIASYSVPIGYNGKNMALSPLIVVQQISFENLCQILCPKQTFFKIRKYKKNKPPNPQNSLSILHLFRGVRRGGWTHLVLCSNLIFTTCTNYLRSQSLNFLTCKG